MGAKPWCRQCLPSQSFFSPSSLNPARSYRHKMKARLVRSVCNTHANYPRNSRPLKHALGKYPLLISVLCPWRLLLLGRHYDTRLSFAKDGAVGALTQKQAGYTATPLIGVVGKHLTWVLTDAGKGNSNCMLEHTVTAS